MDTPPRKRQQRLLIACTACRQIRTRCEGNESQTEPCHRCQRLDLECVYARKRRRTRAALLQEAESPTQSEDVPPASTLLNDHPYSPQPEPPVKLPSQTTSSVMKRYPPRKQAAAVLSKPVDPPSAPSAHSVSPRTYFSASEADLLSPRHEAHNATVGYLNPPIARIRTPTPVSDAQRRPVAGVYADDDPIAMELLSSIEAGHLWLQYMRHLNPLVGLLDPQLHTVQFMRTTSSALLSAVLMCTAQFFRRPLYAPLLAHTRTLTNRATSTGKKCDLGTVQALALMVAWKEPTDGTSGVKLAIAIRLGYQLRLHVHRKVPLPEDETRARIIADGERTWFVISAFDRINSDVFGLPSMIPLSELPECESWAEETDRFHGGDMRHACSTSSASIYLSLIRLRRTYTTMAAEMAYALLTDIYTQMDLHLRHWFPDDQTKGKFSAFEQTVLKWFDISHLLRVKFLMLDVCPPAARGQITTDWLQLAERFTSQTERMAELGCLRYMQDTSVTHLSMFGVVGHKMTARLPPLQRELVVGYVHRLSACCDASRGGGNDHAVMDLVGRFLARLRRVLDEGEEEEESTQAPQDPVGAFNLDEFLRHTFPLPTSNFEQTASLDDQFWSMLFPNPGI